MCARRFFAIYTCYLKYDRSNKKFCWKISCNRWKCLWTRMMIFPRKFYVNFLFIVICSFFLLQLYILFYTYFSAIPFPAFSNYVILYLRIWAFQKFPCRNLNSNYTVVFFWDREPTPLQWSWHSRANSKLFVCRVHRNNRLARVPTTPEFWRHEIFHVKTRQCFIVSARSIVFYLFFYFAD